MNKRLVRTSKVYVADVGLAARLQGRGEAAPLLRSPQAGPMFETLVLGEIVRARDNALRDWRLSFWRTKEGEEIDFLVHGSDGRVVALEAKLGIQSIRPAELPGALRRETPGLTELVLVSSGGEKRLLSKECRQVTVAHLAQYLLARL